MIYKPCHRKLKIEKHEPHGVRVAQSLVFLHHGWETFSGVHVAQSLLYCLMVGRLLVGHEPHKKSTNHNTEN
jgi:hypothetical protein